MQVVALAGGLATRMGGAAKCLAPVRGRPFAAHWMDMFADCELLFLLGNRRAEVQAALHALRSDATFHHSEPRGCGAALLAAKSLLADTFLLYNADTYVERADFAIPDGCLGSMAVCRRDGGNASVYRGLVISYRYSGHANYTDAGAVMLRRSALESLTSDDLHPWLSQLARDDVLAAEEVLAFWDVGTPAGLAAFEERL